MQFTPSIIQLRSIVAIVQFYLSSPPFFLSFSPSTPCPHAPAFFPHFVVPQTCVQLNFGGGCLEVRKGLAPCRNITSSFFSSISSTWPIPSLPKITSFSNPLKPISSPSPSPPDSVAIFPSHLLASLGRGRQNSAEGLAHHFFPHISHSRLVALLYANFSSSPMNVLNCEKLGECLTS